MEEIIAQVNIELRAEGLSMDHVVRTRLWAADRESSDLASEVRAKYNVGRARAATSSYMSPRHFASDALVGLDVVALKSSLAATEKIVIENTPPRRPISYLFFDSLLVLAGKTVVLPTLSEQLDEILPRITTILSEAGSDWDRVVNVSCYLHRSQTIKNLRKGFASQLQSLPDRMKIAYVDGYSAEGKLVEVEVTAETGHRRSG